MQQTTSGNLRYLIDTNCCVYLFTAEFDGLRARVSTAAEGEIGISAITLAELAHGSERGLAPSPEALARLIEQMPVVPFDESAARAYAALPFQRGNFDRLIAAHALSLGCTVISRNVKHFLAIPGVSAEDWTR